MTGAAEPFGCPRSFALGSTAVVVVVVVTVAAAVLMSLTVSPKLPLSITTTLCAQVVL